MARKRYQETERLEILQQVAAGARIADVCRKYGISRTTFHRWQKQHPVREREQAERPKRLGAENGRRGQVEIQQTIRQLEAENARLKRIVVQQALEIDALQESMGRRRDC